MAAQEDIVWKSVSSQIKKIYAAVDALESVFPNRKFTPDGHLVGSIGKELAAYIFDLEFVLQSTKGYDAVTKDGKKVKITLTGGRSIGMRHKPEHLIVLRLSRKCTVDIVYNGPGDVVWNQAKENTSNHQWQVMVTKLRDLNNKVHPNERLEEVNEIPTYFRGEGARLKL